MLKEYAYLFPNPTLLGVVYGRGAVGLNTFGCILIGHVIPGGIQTGGSPFNNIFGSGMSFLLWRSRWKLYLSISNDCDKFAESPFGISPYDY